ncbi:MAG: carboxylating nicotinate-nucleotide diphosphorylase [Eubacterium sp.]|jgi:nicotinate-nucleotide pyrophosphorylase (carboxylating)|nr:carboxylating nicotinate-nucleotide diphosphorylase [Eubacterium sp.]
MNLPDFYVDEIIKTALKEDISYIDVTTDLLVDSMHHSKAFFLSKADGVISGLAVALRVFEILDSGVKTKTAFIDGDPVKKGDVIAEFHGKTAALLKGERTSLNFLQHMSGISTYTAKCVSLVAGTKASIADTRKTLPGLRTLQKYAVATGGGRNHRYNLSDAAMIKDNHIDAYNGITNAVKELRKKAGHLVNIEIEVRDLYEMKEAIAAGVKIIMLDNMPIDQMRKAVDIAEKLTAGQAILEASGNITEENIREIAKTGVDIISLGALTHSVKAFDVSMIWQK